MKEALKLALEALEAADWYIDQLEMIVYCVDDEGTHENRAKVQAAITAIKEALVQPEKGLFIDLIAQHEGLAEELAQDEQEPTEAWPCVIETADFEEDTVTLKMQTSDYKVSAGKHWLSTTPPKRPWVGLTDEEIEEAYAKPTLRKMYQAIEAKLKEKNCV